MRFGAVLLRQLVVLLVVALLAGLSGYAAAAGGIGPAARTWAATPAFSRLDTSLESVPSERPYHEWVSRLLARLIGLQGALRECITLEQPRIVINRDIIIGQLLGDSGIGPAIGAPVTRTSTASESTATLPVDSDDQASAVSWDPILYKVRPGDSLLAIARRFGLDVSTLVDINILHDPDLLHAGQLLIIPPVDGRLYDVREGDVLWAISDRFDVNIGSIIEANGMDDPSVLHVGQVLFIPGANHEVVPTAAAATTSVTQALSWPVPVSGRISSPFGPRMGTMHTGVDIAVPMGTPIVAAASGRVVTARWLGAYGRAVVLIHPASGWKTLYAHASRFVVDDGDWVSAGETIAYVGSSGRSTGPHLHFEVIIDGHPRDPLQYVKRR